MNIVNLKISIVFFIFKENSILDKNIAKIRVDVREQYNIGRKSVKQRLNIEKEEHGRQCLLIYLFVHIYMHKM